MSIESINLWHQRARPHPTEVNFDVQLGCHFEEIVEMIDTLDFTNEDGIEYDVHATRVALNTLARMLKHGELKAHITDRKEFLDAAADQVVTAVGAAHCAGMDAGEAVHRVNRSNWSKYDNDGQPIFNEHGKITKGPNYAPPDLEGLY
jgi:predicted HAD superfamily Cof-like phosphohydrolase